MKFQFCPYCKSELVDNDTLFVCKENDHTIYKNSIPAVATVPIKDNKVLLGKRAGNPQKGKWDAIGGFTEPGENPTDTAIREAKEESNLDIEILDLISIHMNDYLYNNTNYDVMIIYYVVKVVGGEEKPEDDVSELKWFNIEDLPEDEFAFDHLKHGLADVKKWMKENK